MIKILVCFSQYVLMVIMFQSSIIIIISVCLGLTKRSWNEYNTRQMRVTHLEDFEKEKATYHAAALHGSSVSFTLIWP